MADTLTGADRRRCVAADCDQYPDGRGRAEDPTIVHVRIRPRWVRHSDYRPGSSAIRELHLDG